MTLPFFQDYASYTIWANEEVCGWLEQISDEQWTRPVVSSFGTLEATVLHIAGAEKIWHDRLAGIKPASWLPAYFKGSRQEAVETWRAHSKTLLVLISQLEPSVLTSNLAFKRLSGEPDEMPYYQILTHVFNHSTYHRGQIILLLRQLGFDQVNSTDITAFLRKKKKLEVPNS